MANFFENRVLKAVAPVLDTGERAEFFASTGTLFVTTNVPGMSKVVSSLSRAGVGNFKVSVVGTDFAVDFI